MYTIGTISMKEEGKRDKMVCCLVHYTLTCVHHLHVVDCLLKSMVTLGWALYTVICSKPHDAYEGFSSEIQFVDSASKIEICGLLETGRREIFKSLQSVESEG